PHANTFTNIDRFLRECGFCLFDMDVWRYTRGALPGRFCYDIPAVTITGQVQYLDALYMLDPITRPQLFNELAPSQFIKLALLYDIFALPDCAASMILELQGRGIALPGIDYKKILNSLVPKGHARDYAAYVFAFDKNPARFYPSRLKFWNSIAFK